MKKILFLSFVLMVSASCNRGDTNSEKIDLFVQTIILNENQDLSKIYEFISVDSSRADSTKIQLEQIMAFNIEDIRGKLKECSSPYKIILHKETSSKMLENYKLNHSDLGSVYYLICDDKIITVFVVDNHKKIVAFFTKLRKTKEQNYIPWLLN